MQDLLGDMSYSCAPFIVLMFSIGSFGSYVEMLCCVGLCES